MKLSVEEIDGIIHVKYPPKIDYQLIEDFEKHFERHKQIGTQNALVLSDVSELSFFPLHMRMEYVSRIKELQPLIRKSAVCGINNIAIKTAIKITIHLSNRNNIRIFNKKEDAIEWLKK